MEMNKKIAETEANKKLEVAKIEQQEAEAKAGAMKKLAEAKQKQIELSGAITEQEQIRLELEKDTRIGVAKAVADGIGKAKWPTNVIMAGGGSSTEGKKPVSYIPIVPSERKLVQQDKK